MAEDQRFSASEPLHDGTFRMTWHMSPSEASRAQAGIAERKRTEETTFKNIYADLLGKAIEASRAGDKERFDLLATTIGCLKMEYPWLERAFTDENGRPHG